MYVLAFRAVSPQARGGSRRLAKAQEKLLCLNEAGAADFAEQPGFCPAALTGMFAVANSANRRRYVIYGMQYF